MRRCKFSVGSCCVAPLVLGWWCGGGQPARNSRKVMCIVEQHPVPQMLYFYDEFRWGDGSPPLPFLYTLVILVRLYVISLLCLYSIIIFYLNRKKCTEGHLPCTNGIVLIQKAGMKRCSLPTTPFLPGFYPNFYSGSIISVTNTPGSFCLLMYPPYFSTTRLIRFNPCP